MPYTSSLRDRLRVSRSPTVDILERNYKKSDFLIRRQLNPEK